MGLVKSPRRAPTAGVRLLFSDRYSSTAAAPAPPTAAIAAIAARSIGARERLQLPPFVSSRYQRLPHCPLGEPSPRHASGLKSAAIGTRSRLQIPAPRSPRGASALESVCGFRRSRRAAERRLSHGPWWRALAVSQRQVSGRIGTDRDSSAAIGTRERLQLLLRRTPQNATRGIGARERLQLSTLASRGDRRLSHGPVRRALAVAERHVSGM